MPADKANAEAIRNLTRDAEEHMRNAEVALREAIRLAQDDYDHNADQLGHVYGALHLLTGTVAGEYFRWRDYASARAGVVPVPPQPPEMEPHGLGSVKPCHCGRLLNYWVSRDYEHETWLHADDNTEACAAVVPQDGEQQ